MTKYLLQIESDDGRRVNLAVYEAADDAEALKEAGARARSIIEDDAAWHAKATPIKRTEYGSK